MFLYIGIPCCFWTMIKPKDVPAKSIYYCLLLQWLKCKDGKRKGMQRGTTLKRLVMNWKWQTYCRLIIRFLTHRHISSADRDTAHGVTVTYHSGRVVGISLQLAALGWIANMFLSLAADGATTSSLFLLSLPSHLSLLQQSPHLSLRPNFLCLPVSVCPCVCALLLPRLSACLPYFLYVCECFFDLLKDVCFVSRTECLPALLRQCHQIG